MADCSEKLLLYNNKISLSKTDRKYLRNARNSVVRKIKKYFYEKEHCPKVEFIGQGSFSIGTIIKPFSGDYDIDVGVYLRGYGDWRSNWPKPETASQWLVNALQNHTTTPPINKRTCVRVIYKPIAIKKREIGYHVDLPIYCEYENLLGNKMTRIGINGDTQWGQKSDPIGFNKWFNGKCQKNESDKDQLVRIVKYIKAWKEFTKGDFRFPSGFALTILIAENYVPDRREDIAFKETIRSAFNTLNGLFGVNDVTKPVEPYNNVLAKLSSNQLKKFMSCLGKFVDDCKFAIETTDVSTAYSLWEGHFDERMKQVSTSKTRGTLKKVS